MSEPTIDDLLGNLVRAKRAEELAKAARIAAEDVILATLAERPEKGNVKLGSGVIKAKIEFKLSYKADVEAIRKLGGEVPLKLVPESYELDEKAYEALRAARPELFAKIAQFVTTKPSKPSFELKV